MGPGPTIGLVKTLRSRAATAFSLSCVAALLAAGPTAAQVTVLVGDTVLCDGSRSEGHPSSYEWFVTEPGGGPPSSPTATGQSFPLMVDAAGTWTVELVASYAHQAPDGGSYQSTASTTFNAQSVVAELTLSSTLISTDEPLFLDGTASRWAPGVTPVVAWKVDATPWASCNTGVPPSSPDDLTCTIEPGSLPPGDYLAKLQLYDPASGDFHQRRRAFTVYEPVDFSVDFLWIPDNPDPGQLVQLQIEVTPAGMADDLVTATWAWDDGSPPDQVPCHPYGCLFWSHTFGSEGWYDVHLVVETPEETAEVTRTIQVGDPPLPPSASFSVQPAAPQLLQTVVFTFTGSCQEPCSYVWSFGDGGTASVASPTHAYATPGSYTAHLTVTNGGGSDGAQAPISVSQCWTPPPPSQDGSCYGGAVTLTAAAGAAWLWSTGETSRSVLVGLPGPYWVDVDAGGSCWGQAVRTVTLTNCGSSSGDANLDGITDAADLTALLRELTDGDGTAVTSAGGGELTAPGGDVNHDGLLDADDLEAIVAILFASP